MQCVAQLAAAAPAAAAARASTSGRRPAAAAARPLPARRRQVAAHAKVELLDLDGSIHVLDVEEGQNVLEVALDAGLDMPHDCKTGVCMRCSAMVESGNVEQPGGMISEECQSQGYALMCVATPQSDCRIRVIPEEELVDAVMGIA